LRGDTPGPLKCNRGVSYRTVVGKRIKRDLLGGILANEPNGRDSLFLLGGGGGVVGCGGVGGVGFGGGGCGHGPHPVVAEKKGRTAAYRTRGHSGQTREEG